MLLSTKTNEKYVIDFTLDRTQGYNDLVWELSVVELYRLLDPRLLGRALRPGGLEDDSILRCGKLDKEWR